MNKLIALAALAATAAAQCDGTTTETIAGGTVVCTSATADTNTCGLTCANGMTASGSITCNASNVYVNSSPVAACPPGCSGSTTETITDGTVVCTAATADTNTCVLTCDNSMTATGTITCDAANGVYVNSSTAAACPATAAPTCSGSTTETLTDGTVDCATATADTDTCGLTCTNGMTATGSITCTVSGATASYVAATPACPPAAAAGCTGAVPVGADGIVNGTATCAGAGSCTVTCADGYTANANISLICATGGTTSTYSFGGLVCEADAAAGGSGAGTCDGMYAQADSNAGSTVDCAAALAVGDACKVNCLPMLEAVSATLVPKCTAMGYAPLTGLCIADVATTLKDADFEKAGCKVREADIKEGGSLADAAMPLGARPSLQLLSDSLVAIKAGKQVTEAKYTAAVLGVTLTDAQVTNIKKLFCVGSNFVTAAVALAVAFVLAK